MSRLSAQKSQMLMSASGKYPFGPAINNGPISRPTSTVKGKPERTLHDPLSYWDTKMDKSAPYFRNTRVQTCSHILRQNGKSVAVQFPLAKTGWKAPTSYQNTARSSEVMSWSR